MPCPDSFTTGNDPVATVEGKGWAQGPIYIDAGNLAPAWIISPDCPAHSKSLHRPRYTGPKGIYIEPKLNAMYIISVFLAVSEFLNFTTTVKQKVASLF